MNLPLFPLQMCILPNGYSKLRIFEPRYQRLVKESLKNDLGFGACMLDEDNKTLLPIGTRCNIIDFETLDDGLLGITIVGIDRFELGTYTIEKDGLKRGNVSALPAWQTLPIEAHQQKYTQILQDLLKEYPEHISQYKLDNFMDLSWVCQRWIEILPISPSEKQHCMSAKDPIPTLAMLNDVLK
ncbi:LON peptidase substrate-binding domain-containing protein [Shewanella fidelis]|uniref:LON peptidase substrate-binding domain-containing protein n=1 Tax=Shewanella fidelis TaxID=173509 RepID=A0AAW8NLR6_9GAMM|nr:LON peptidase substrate-binding domain-containing protein [Shewanella fidelis]MDR8523636.1 LON peptidase substrate-binding domain-containing protein [Shewanella fidelis]MDW4810183.1 LON peptidase substrate-binding domain-containing protein [Shewanella fidelis]MDW4814328.1 LON peptidase substrate-binding domain-containing protein [Shewanella fidelis]MDW4818419.1 LON peptidase substrate-binding domain-containing protein [Shewanella fidelis]MDW4823929.1 LON peptidase substrate-binding domain-c